MGQWAELGQQLVNLEWNESLVMNNESNNKKYNTMEIEYYTGT